MCIGNTTSPAASNTTNMYWRRADEWETPQVITPAEPSQTATTKKKDTLKTSSSKSQSSKTTGGTY